MGEKNHFSCMHYMYLSPFFNPISIDIIQELARNTESQAPLPPPESERTRSTDDSYAHRHTRNSALYDAWRDLKTSFILSCEKPHNGHH